MPSDPSPPTNDSTDPLLAIFVRTPVNIRVFGYLRKEKSSIQITAMNTTPTTTTETPGETPVEVGTEIQRSAIAAEGEKCAPGGENPEEFDVLEAWYPVHYLEDLSQSTLTRFTLLERNLVIWWDRNGQTWRAFEDSCPHRLVPLSEGRINEEGLLECPYHGWTFAGNGQCDRIPQQEQGSKPTASKRACAVSLPTTTRHGMLFLYPGQPENAEKTALPIISPLEESPDGWVCLKTFRDLPYDALTLLENVLDSSHVPYTHHGTVGNRASAGAVELEVVSFGKQGFEGLWEEGPRQGTLGRQTTTFVAPSLMWHDLTSKQFGRTLTVVYATPIRKGECRLFAIFPFKFSSKIPGLFMKLTPRWFNHLRQHAILEDDQIFLHYQERNLEAKGGSPQFAQAFYLPTKADRFVAQLHQWVNQYRIDPFPSHSLPPRRSTEQLLDRYHSHTIHCASCATALANVKRVRNIAGIAAAIAWIIAPALLVFLEDTPTVAIAFCTVVSLVCGAIWLRLAQLERDFYRGSEVPTRNLPN